MAPPYSRNLMLTDWGNYSIEKTAFKLIIYTVIAIIECISHML